jgi:hypothetical protein
MYAPPLTGERDRLQADAGTVAGRTPKRRRKRIVTHMTSTLTHEHNQYEMSANNFAAAARAVDATKVYGEG